MDVQCPSMNLSPDNLCAIDPDAEKLTVILKKMHSWLPNDLFVVEYIGLVVPINVGGEVEYPVNLETGNQDAKQFYDVDLLNELGKAVEKVISGQKSSL